jgi:hypothetical protein
MVGSAIKIRLQRGLMRNDQLWTLPYHFYGLAHISQSGRKKALKEGGSKSITDNY